MSESAKLVISTAAAAILSAVYWVAFLLFAEGFTAGDYRYGAAPSEGVLWLKSAIVVIGGPTLFGFMIAGWRRLERRFITGREDRV